MTSQNSTPPPGKRSKWKFIATAILCIACASPVSAHTSASTNLSGIASSAGAKQLSSAPHLKKKHKKHHHRAVVRLTLEKALAFELMTAVLNSNIERGCLRTLYPEPWSPFSDSK